MINGGRAVDVVYMDISKPFDQASYGGHLDMQGMV